jgi:hypothetical protein
MGRQAGFKVVRMTGVVGPIRAPENVYVEAHTGQRRLTLRQAQGERGGAASSPYHTGRRAPRVQCSAAGLPSLMVSLSNHEPSPGAAYEAGEERPSVMWARTAARVASSPSKT